MFFLLSSIIISELRYNEEIRRLNERIERICQKYEQFKKENYEKLEKENGEIIKSSKSIEETIE